MSRLATTRFGVDSTSPVPVSALKEVGASFCIRYLSRYSWKILRPGEYQTLHAHNIGLGFVFEDDVEPLTLSFARGVEDAEFCKRQARSLGVPGTFPCFWACDRPTGGDVIKFEPYAQGFASVFGRSLSGPYGDYYICSHFGNQGYMAWQCTAAWGWNGGRNYESQNFYRQAACWQYSNGHRVGGVDVDFDTLLDDRCLIGSHYLPPPPKEVEEGMISATVNKDGRLEVFVEAKDGEVFHTWQKDAGGAWEGSEAGKRSAAWHSMGTPGK